MNREQFMEVLLWAKDLTHTQIWEQLAGQMTLLELNTLRNEYRPDYHWVMAKRAVLAEARGRGKELGEAHMERRLKLGHRYQ